jgi:hypothetical protein
VTTRRKIGIISAFVGLLAVIFGVVLFDPSTGTGGGSTPTATPTTTAVAPVSTTDAQPTTGTPTTTMAPPVDTTVTTETAPGSTSVQPPASFPTAATTGATGTLTAASGDVKLDTAGQVYQNVRLDGTITVHACDVVIRNVQVDASEPLATPVNSTEDLFAIWLKEPATCGVTLDHVSVLTPASLYATEAVRNAEGGPMTITGSRFVGQQLGVTIGGDTVLSGNYIELGATMRGDHNEDILDDGTTNLTITGNTLLNPNGQTSTLSLFTEFGSNHDVLVQGNLMAGGGYTCYCGDGATDNAGKPAPADNVSFVDNVFWRKYFPDAGAFAAGRAYNPAGGGVWTGNGYMAADGTLTGQPVAQPPLDGK